METEYFVAPSRCPFPVAAGNHIRWLPLFGPMEEIAIPPIEGGHGGADGAIQQDLFIGISEESSRLQLPAGSLAGAYAVSLGESIARSIAESALVTLPRFEEA